MRCPSCSSETPEGARFCIECGGPLQPRCPRCGDENLPQAKFCAADTGLVRVPRSWSPSVAGRALVTWERAWYWRCLLFPFTYSHRAYNEGVPDKQGRANLGLQASKTELQTALWRSTYMEPREGQGATRKHSTS